MSIGSKVKEDELAEAWRGVLDRHARISCALDCALRQHDLGVSEFEVLERLAEADGPAARRMQDLAESTHLSQSALSRVVGRLEKDGLVRRGMCSDDRRGIVVCITDAGRDRFAAAKPAQRQVLLNLLG